MTTSLQLCTYQVSGKDAKFLTDDRLKILKNFNVQQEKFFLHMKTISLSDPKAFILKFIPKYYGPLTLDRDISMHYEDTNQSQSTILWLSHLASRYKQRIEANKFMILQNFTSQYEFPCVFDIKVGQRNDIKKGSTINGSVINYCFKLNGCRISYPNEERQIFLSKYHLQTKIDMESIVIFIALFFFDGNRLNIEAIRKIRQRLTEFILGFRSTKGYLFVSSSILLLYDAKNPSKADLKFIDFSRFRQNSPDFFDQKSCIGLENIHMILGRILESRNNLIPKLTQLKEYYLINNIELIPDKKKSKNIENCLTPSPKKRSRLEIE